MRARTSAGAQGLQPPLNRRSKYLKNDYDPRGMPISCLFATVRAALRQIRPLLLAYLCARDSRAQAPVDVKLVEKRIAARRIQNGWLPKNIGFPTFSLKML
jgi:hypothetical protein